MILGNEKLEKTVYLSFYWFNDSWTREFELATREFELTTRRFELVSCKAELMAPEFEFVDLNS